VTSYVSPARTVPGLYGNGGPGVTRKCRHPRAELTRRNMDMFAAEVMPHLRD
jgi:hypothetical protein